MQKGYSVMQGYCNDPEQTAEVVIDDWMHTGDLAVIDEPGYHKYSWIILNLGSSCKADEIRSFCHNQIAHFKVPHYIEFVTEISMTVTGKPQKYLMREEMVRRLGLQEVKSA
jgi:fatty-acyl-CoA synthase